MKSTGKKVKPGTVNRMLNTLMAVLNAAVSWDWITHAPKASAVPEKEKRVMWLTHDQASRLIAALPKHLADMAYFSLETGLRRSNVTGLKWTQVDIARKMAWIHPDEAKANRAIPVPLSDAAIEILRQQRFAKRHPEHIDFVFVYRGKPIHQTATKAWRNALVQTGVSNFRWHDLRHTWASWHIQKGTPVHVLQALGGWETERMVQRYAHLSADHLAEWVGSGHILVHTENQERKTDYAMTT